MDFEKGQKVIIKTGLYWEHGIINDKEWFNGKWNYYVNRSWYVSKNITLVTELI